MFHANSLPSSPSTHHRPPLILRFSFRFSRFSTMSRFPTVSFNLYPRLRFLSPFSLLALEFSSILCRPESRRIFFPLSRKSLSPFPMYRSRDPPVFLFKDFLRPFLDIFLPSPSSFSLLLLFLLRLWKLAHARRVYTAFNPDSGLALQDAVSHATPILLRFLVHRDTKL